MRSKLILIIYLSLASYLGLTQIKFDRMSDPFPARLYDRENREDVSNIENILRKESGAIKSESNNTLAIAFIDPRTIGFIKTKQKAKFKIKSNSVDPIKTTGVVVAIANSAKEPDPNVVDYFHYYALLKIEDRTIEQEIDKKTRFPITTRIVIDEDFTILDWLKIKYSVFFSFKYLANH